MKSPVVDRVVTHPCAVGLVSRDDLGHEGPFKKPTRFISNSVAVLRQRLPYTQVHYVVQSV